MCENYPCKGLYRCKFGSNMLLVHAIPLHVTAISQSNDAIYTCGLDFIRIGEITVCFKLDHKLKRAKYIPLFGGYIYIVCSLLSFVSQAVKSLFNMGINQTDALAV